MKKLYLTLMAALTAVMSFAQTTVTPPNTATQETWTVSYTFTYLESSENDSESMAVAFDGDDVYFNFPNPVSGNAWIKGTKDSETGAYLFASGQYIGSNSGTNFYLCGGEGSSLTENMTFYYSASSKTFTCYGYILLNLSQTEFSPVAYFTNVVITSSDVQPEEPETLIEVPEGLTTEKYVFTGSSISYNADRSIAGMESVSFMVNVGFHGTNEVYIQGMCPAMPEAWVKGTIANDDEVTFEKGQYLGRSMTNVYLCGQSFGELSDLMLIWDQEKLQFDARSYYVVINSNKTELAPYYVFAGVKITKYVEKAATPANPVMLAYAPYNSAEGYQNITFRIPTVDTDGNPLSTDKLSYKLWKDVDGSTELFVLSKTVYTQLNDDMTEIPFSYTDNNYDIVMQAADVRTIYLYSETLNFHRIGVQSIYRGNNTEMASDIAWQTLDTSGISQATAGQVVSERYTDLLGRDVSADTKGLLIRQQRMADGTVRTTKVVRR